MKLALILVLSGLLTQPLFANSSDESKKRSKMSSSHYDSILSSIEANDINSLKESLDTFKKILKCTLIITIITNSILII